MYLCVFITAKSSSRFPSIDQSYGKGYFPYKTISPEWYEYEGDMPDVHYFGCNDSDKPEVERFVAEHGNECWNWKEQIHIYLRKDIKLLTAGLCRFVQEFAEFQDSFEENRPETFLHPFSPPFITVMSLT